MQGWDNTTYRLGEDKSVRLPTADRYVPQVDKEQRWLPALAAQLPLPIPQPLAQGAPGCGFPRPWSIYRWLNGEPAADDRIADLTQFAVDLADFLTALQRIDTAAGPLAGRHSFFRGGALTVYNEETRRSIRDLGAEIEANAAIQVWETALASTWTGKPVWVHGDVAPSNLLVEEGRLSAVIDFGCLAVGDPACDTVIAWSFLHGSSREAFRAHLSLDEATWARGRGWALWKALITLAHGLTNSVIAGWRQDARELVNEVLADYRSDG